MTLPDFPVDPATLDLLYSAIHPDPDVADRSSVSDLLGLFSQLGGSDVEAVESVDDGIYLMRDPQYHTNDVLGALIDEIRRLRLVSGRRAGPW